MRSALFRKILTRLEKHTPDRLLRLQYQILLNTTARAFSVPSEHIRARDPARALREYADFSRSCMERGQAEPERLYREAFRTGARIRRLCGFSEPDDLCRLVFYLYRSIRIHMQGEIPGELRVTDCYFSAFYTPEQCRLMSCIDSGLIAGLFGGSALRFSQRITEGCGDCRACFCAKSGKEIS